MGWGLPWWLSKESDYGRPRFDPWVRKILWRREWLPTPVFLPGGFHRQGAWWAIVHAVTKSDMTE